MIIGTMPKQVEYALMILQEMQLAEAGRLFTARELCDRHGAPFDVVSKVLQRLVRAGMVRSIQGKHGGYQFGKELCLVSLLQLIEAVQGEVAVANCLKSGRHCVRCEHCTIVGAMGRLDRMLRELYGGLLLSDLLGLE